MPAYVDRSGLKVDPALVTFLEERALPGTGVSADTFWSGFASLLEQKGPINRDLLQQRQAIQEKIDGS